MLPSIHPVFVIGALLLVGGTLGCFVLALRRLPALGFLFLLVYTVLTKELSVLFLDTHSVFITESGMVSQPSWAWARFILCNTAMFMTAAVAVQLLNRVTNTRHDTPIQRPSADARTIAIVVLAGVLGLQFLNIVLTRHVALPGTGVDRYNYWTTYAKLPFLPSLFGQLMVFVPFVGACLYFTGFHHQHPYTRKVGGATIIAYFIVLILHGQRFNGIMVGSSTLVGAYCTFKRSRREPLVDTTNLRRAALALGVLLAFNLAAFSFRELGREFGSSSAMLYRILVLQGQSYWSAEAVSQYQQGTFDDLFRGLEFTMEAVGSPSLVSAFSERGVNFAVSLPGTLIMVGGLQLAFAGSVAYGALYGLIAFIMGYATRQGAVVLAFPASYLWLTVHTAYSAGSLEPLTGAKFGILAFTVTVFIAFRWHLRDRRSR